MGKADDLREVPLAKLLRESVDAPQPAPQPRSKPRPRWTRHLPLPRPTVDALDVAQARTALSDEGLRVEALTTLADLLADGAKLQPRGRHARAAAAVLQRHLHTVDMPSPYARLVVRADDAVADITSYPVWSTALFDERHVRIDPVTEAAAIRSRLRRLTAVTVTSSSEPRERRLRVLPRAVAVPDDTRLAAASREVETSTAARVAAMETYRDQVRECDDEWRRLRTAESAELNAGRIDGLLADTGADGLRIDDLRQLTDESRAAVEGIRRALELMDETSSSLWWRGSDE